MGGDARSVAAAGAGGALAGAARVVAALRTAAKPLHPRGTTWSAILERRGGSATGATWLDEPGTSRAVVRQSRAVGFPEGWPDVHGLAIRAELPDGGHADVLLASTGWGPIGRFVLLVGRRPEAMFLGSLLPYRSPSGPVLLGALPLPDRTWNLLCALGRSPWTPFARLALEDRMAGEGPSFDPVRNQPPGLEQYDALARLRLPAYRTARRTRGDHIVTI